MSRLLLCHRQEFEHICSGEQVGMQTRMIRIISGKQSKIRNRLGFVVQARYQLVCFLVVLGDVCLHRDDSFCLDYIADALVFENELFYRQARRSPIR